jgi:hypothetical protein
LSGVSAPELPPTEGLTLVLADQEGNDQVTARRLVGKRRWSYSVIPEAAGTFELPGIGMSYFDPELATYERAAAAPLRLVVEPTLSEPEVSRTEGAAAPVPPAGETGRTQLWGWINVSACLILALLLPFAILGWRRRRAQDAMANASAPEARLGANLRTLAGDERPRRAAKGIEEGFRDYLARSWGIPESIPILRWGDALRERGAPESLSRRLAKLVDDVRYLRDAPHLFPAAAMQAELVESSLDLLRELSRHSPSEE